jgi:hypothetical protein
MPRRDPGACLQVSQASAESGHARNRIDKDHRAPERIALLRAVLRGDPLVPAGAGLAIVRALPHGHMLAALGMARRLGLDPRITSGGLLPRGPTRRRRLAWRWSWRACSIRRPSSPPPRALDAACASHSLGATLELGTIASKEVCAARELARLQERVRRARQPLRGVAALGRSTPFRRKSPSTSGSRSPTPI